MKKDVNGSSDTALNHPSDASSAAGGQSGGDCTQQQISNSQEANLSESKAAKRAKRVIDLCIYESADIDFDGNQGTVEYIDKTSWGFVVVPIAVISKKRISLFHPDAPSLDTTATSRGETGDNEYKERMIEYITKIRYCQHRDYIFSIYVYGSRVRLIRWDCSGAIVCEPFNIKKEHEKLHRFLFRLGKMTRTQWGYDGSVWRATEEEAERFRSYQPQYANHKIYKDAARTCGPEL